MRFKKYTALLCLVFSTVTLAGGPPPVEPFVLAQFTNAPPASTLTLTGQVINVIQEIMGYAYPQREIVYWQEGDQTVWILDARGKSNTITAGFVIRAGRLEKTEVLVYRERRGRQVRSRAFTRQFEGALLTGEHQLDRRIDGITGATISVRAMQAMARVALFLHQYITGTGNPGS